MFTSKVAYLGPTLDYEHTPPTVSLSDIAQKEHSVKKTREGQILTNVLRKEMGEFGEANLKQKTVAGLRIKADGELPADFVGSVQTFHKNYPRLPANKHQGLASSENTENSLSPSR